MQTISYKTQNLENIQSLMAKEGKYSIEDLNALIDRIIEATKLDENQIAVSVGRNQGYISQCRSRGKVSDNFIELLKMKYKTELEGVKHRVAGQASGTSKAEGTLEAGNLVSELIASLKRENALLQNQAEEKLNLESLRSGLEHELKTNRMLLQVIYEWTKEQRAKDQPSAPAKVTPPKPQEKKKIDGKTGEDSQKDGTYTRTSKKDK